MNTLNTLEHTIESILFIAGEPMKISKLGKLTSSTDVEVSEAIQALQEFYKERGIRIVRDEHQVQLATSPENENVVRHFVKEDLEGELTKTTAEVLAIIAYRGPTTRAEIESIRGVNCTSQIRTLLLRKLIERIPNPNDARAYTYQMTLDMLRTLGLEKVEDLPKYHTIINKNDSKNEERTAQKEENV